MWTSPKGKDRDAMRFRALGAILYWRTRGLAGWKAMWHKYPRSHVQKEPIRTISEAKQTAQRVGKSEQRLVLVLHLGRVFWPNTEGRG